MGPGEEEQRGALAGAQSFAVTRYLAVAIVAVVGGAGLEAGVEVDCELFGGDDEPHAATQRRRWLRCASNARSEFGGATPRRDLKSRWPFPATISRKLGQELRWH